MDGVARMISPSSGLADMFSRKSNRNLTKGVRIDLEDNRVSVDITITVDYGSPVPDVARNIQENVKKAIETMSGLDVKKVDDHVTGISFEREQRANAELDEQHRKMLEKTAESEAEAPVDATEYPEEGIPEVEEADDEEDFAEDDLDEEDLDEEDPVDEEPEAADADATDAEAPSDDEDDAEDSDDDEFVIGAEI